MATYRILIIDDNEMIHDDFRQSLLSEATNGALGELEASLFGPPRSQQTSFDFELVCASQGQEGLLRVEESLRAERPFSLAFVDMRMPPGWDGLVTVNRLWQVDPEIQVVICTAYSDYTWQETTERLGNRNQLLFLKKPFDMIEVLQLARALTQHWSCRQDLRARRARKPDAITSELLASMAAAVDHARRLKSQCPDASLDEFIAAAQQFATLHDTARGDASPQA